MRHQLLILLHVWTAHSSFDVIGAFGWFYGDFFLHEYPRELYYTGIYRFLNNPERTMGGAAYFGLVLISGSRLVFVHAVASLFAHWWFLSAVENPHMRKLYGETLRKDAGVTKTLRRVADRNSHLFSGVSRGVRDIQGTVERVYEDTAEVVEDFLHRCKPWLPLLSDGRSDTRNAATPRLSEVVESTKVRLQQSKEKLVITYVCNVSPSRRKLTGVCSRVASNIQDIERSKYHLDILPSRFERPASGRQTVAGDTEFVARFRLGEPISLEWRAPASHSPRDWIGVYRHGANDSKLVTRISSQGHWIGVDAAGWQGDTYGRSASGRRASSSSSTSGPRGRSASSTSLASDFVPRKEDGLVTFTHNRLPWSTGLYEFR